MNRKLKTNQESFTSFLPLVKRRKFLLLFSRNTDKRIAWLSGYNHLAIVEYTSSDLMVIMEPHFWGCSIRTCPTAMFPKLPKEIKIIEITVTNTRTNKLIRPLLQTCATLVQYIAGIDLGIFLVQTLYDYLTQTDPLFLKAKGIHKLKVWET